MDLIEQTVKDRIADIEKAIDLNKDGAKPFKGDIRLGKGEAIRYKAASDFLLERAVPANVALNLNSAIAEKRAVFGGNKRYAESHAIPANIDKGSLIATNRRIFFKGRSKSHDIPFSQIKSVIYYPDALEIITGENDLTSLVFQVERPRLFSYIISDADWGAPLALKAFVSKEYLDGVLAHLKRLTNLLGQFGGTAIKEKLIEDRDLDHRLADVTEDYFDSVVGLVKFETGLYKGALLEPASSFATDYINYFGILSEVSRKMRKEADKAEAGIPKNLSKKERGAYLENRLKTIEEEYAKKLATPSADLNLKAKRAVDDIKKMEEELNRSKGSDEPLTKRMTQFFVFPNGWASFLMIMVVGAIGYLFFPNMNKTAKLSAPETLISFILAYYVLRLSYCCLRYLYRALTSKGSAPNKSNVLVAIITAVIAAFLVGGAMSSGRTEKDKDRELRDLRREVEDLKRKSA